MTKEDKELLFKDLCARLPYKVMAKYYDSEDECETWDEVEGIESSGHVEIGQYVLPIENVKPYLFPLSSMTEEQKKVYYDKYCLSDYYAFEKFDWFNKNHFDYRGLIPKGLAIDATNKNIY